MESKAKSQTKHALRRAYERFGLRLNEYDLQDCVRRIQKGEATLVSSQTNRITIHALVVKDIPVHLVYDKDRKTIVSFLTEGMGQ